MTNNGNDYGRIAFDKTEEIERRLTNTLQGEPEPEYAEKTVTEVCSSSPIDCKVIKNFRWKLYASAGGQVTVDINVDSGSGVNVYLTYNGEVIFDTEIEGGKAVMHRGGGVPVGINEIDVVLSANEPFTVTVTVNRKGKFTVLSDEDALINVGQSDYAFLSGGKLTVYKGSNGSPLFSLYGVDCAGATKLSNGNYCIAAERIMEGASIFTVSPSGELGVKRIPSGKFTAFAVAADGNSAIVYGARQSRLVKYVFDGNSLTEEQTAVRAVGLKYTQNGNLKLLRVKNPIGYEYVYEV